MAVGCDTDKSRSRGISQPAISMRPLQLQHMFPTCYVRQETARCTVSQRLLWRYLTYNVISNDHISLCRESIIKYGNCCKQYSLIAASCAGDKMSIKFSVWNNTACPWHEFWNPTDLVKSTDRMTPVPPNSCRHSIYITIGRERQSRHNRYRYDFFLSACNKDAKTMLRD